MFTKLDNGIRLIILSMVGKDKAVFRELESNLKVTLYLNEVIS